MKLVVELGPECHYKTARLHLLPLLPSHLPCCLLLLSLLLLWLLCFLPFSDADWSVYKQFFLGRVVSLARSSADHRDGDTPMVGRAD